MIKLSITRLLALICICFSIFTLSCEKDNEVNDGVAQLLSFGPTGANIGDTLKIIGNNLQNVTAVVLTGATVDKANFKKHTSEEIFLIIPASTVRGKITLKVPEGDVTSITELDLGVTTTITSFTSQARPGENITINGTFLNWIKRITFANDKLVTSFVSQSETQLVVKIPDDAQTGPLVIFYSGTDSALIQTPDTLKVTLPAVTNMTPNPVGHGTDLTITGTNLDLVKQLIFTNVSAPVTTFVSQSATQIVVKTPTTAMPGKLTMKVASGVTVTTTQDLGIVLPAVTGMTPSPIKHADNLTITGTNLDLVKEIVFTNANSITSFVSQTATQIVVKVPAAAKTGKLNLKVASGVGVFTTQDVTLILPTTTNLSPNPIDPNTDLTITGTNLDLVTGISFVGIANPITTFVSQSATQIVVKVPYGSLKGKLGLSFVNCSYQAESGQSLDVIGLPPLAAFPFPIYTDGLNSGYGDWSWAARDMASTQIVRQGTISIKATYGGNTYEGIRFHNDNGPADLSAYTKLEFSIFGTAGTGGKTMNVVINEQWGAPVTVIVVEGGWTTYSINISALPNPSPLKDVILQSAGWTGVVHIDHVGLR